MIGQFELNFEPRCLPKEINIFLEKNIINTLVLGLKTQKCFLIFVIHTKIQFDPTHYSSELDTNNSEEL